MTTLTAHTGVTTQAENQRGHRPVNLGANPNPPAKRRLRRVISREQGAALETIGHAVDYLNDSLLWEGPDSDILTGPCPAMEAVQILISRHLELLHSLPLVEPLSHRIWKSMFHRAQSGQSVPVIPWSSR